MIFKYTCPKYKEPEEKLTCYYDNMERETYYGRPCEHCIGPKVRGKHVCKVVITDKASKKVWLKVLRMIGRAEKRIRCGKKKEVQYDNTEQD